ncbi:MAG: long-chain fatty acid--CoA ligase [Acetobacteraceae bacterium]|nr:long-chain fatty acid--CoA ligase [Acetobacteraceae bacterium]
MQEFSRRPWLSVYPEGVRPSLEYPPVPLHRLVEDAARRFPRRAATEFFGGRMSYRELALEVDAFAAGLQRLGVAKGDRVAVILPNCPQCVIAYYGIMKAGGVVVMVNPMYVERELQYQLSDAGARTVVVLDHLYPRLSRVREAVGVKDVVWTGMQDYLPFPLSLLYPVKARREKHQVGVPAGPGIHRFTALSRGRGRPEPVDVGPDDLALLQYTGGTTGVSKGAMLSHRNLMANVVQTVEWLVGSRPGEEKVLAVLPFFHVYGMTCALNFSVALAATMVLHPRFVIKDILKSINRSRPTLFPGAPTMYVAVINHPRVKDYDIRSITACISGSAPLPIEVQERFEELTGGRLVEGYGLTEASPVTHCNPIYGRRKAGSIGLPFPDTDAWIVDLETGSRWLEPGEIGELAVRAPQVMVGYWNRPDETAAVLRDGWLLTGDVARVDEEGYFYIVDRKKDVIIAGGFNVYPREVEEVLYEHPKVREAAVIGVPDPYRGETVKAFVVLKEGQAATAEEMVAFCEERLARFKVPRLVEFRADLPKTMVGKVLRRVLAEEEAARRAAQPPA